MLQQLVALENTERIVQTTADIVLTMNPAIDLMGDVMIVRLDIMVLNVIKVCCFLLFFWLTRRLLSFIFFNTIILPCTSHF